MARFYHPDQQPQHQSAFQRGEGDQFADSREVGWTDEGQEDAYDPEYGEGYGDYEEYGDPEEFPEDYPPLEEDLWDEELFNEEEKEMLRRERWHTLAHLGDFAGVIAGTAVILVLVALLISLINWVQADVSQFFTLWQTQL